MINIADKKKCCGCSACASICPKQCICMVADSEGFLYPHVEVSDCIDCGLCEKVCNELHPYDKRTPQNVLAAINKNEDIRLESSSGGIFYILAEKTINEGGVVFGARFDEQWQVLIDYTEDINGVRAFMGSKYVQARIENAYKDVRRFLKEERKVLFSGTPCQVAGLHKFLRKTYDNLLTVDFICHGTPSPKVWALYLKDVVDEAKCISSLEFRNKQNGWKNFCFNLRYNKGDQTVSLLTSFRNNPYIKAFLYDIILRPSCYDCKAKGCSSQSDITIADFWGIQTIFPDMDDDKGTSMVFINTDKGRTLLDLSKVKNRETTFENIKRLNPVCCCSVSESPKRKYFFNHLDSEDFVALVNDCTKPTIIQQVIMKLRVCKRFVHRILMGGGNELVTLNVIQTYCEQISQILKNPHIVSVSFRNKDAGWKNYNIEIKIK